MGFKKIGEDTPVQGYIDAKGKAQVCDSCNKPLVAIAIQDDGSVDLVCNCDELELN